MQTHLIYKIHGLTSGQNVSSNPASPKKVENTTLVDYQ
jgi:hypothetical protein